MQHQQPTWINHPCNYCQAPAGEPCRSPQTNKVCHMSHYSREPQSKTTTNSDTATIQALTNFLVWGNG